MGNPFYADPVKLDQSSQQFDDLAASTRAIPDWVSGRVDPMVHHCEVDEAGEVFAQQIRAGVGPASAILRGAGYLFGQTGQNVRDTAALFRASDQVNTAIVNHLHK
jgi:hypothetical protein